MTTPHQQTTPTQHPFPPPPPFLPSPQPLPLNPYNQDDRPDWHSAFNEALAYEEVDKMRGRLLGYLLTEAPTDDGRSHVAHEINCCRAKDESLWDLSQLYIDHLIRLFKHNKGPTPEPSTHPSNPDFDLEKLKQGEIVSAPISHATAKQLALDRDAYRCPISGDYDIAVPDALHEDKSSSLSLTQAAHIFTPSTNARLDAPRKTATALIFAFSRIDILDELQGDQAHRLSNILTLRNDIHGLFDKLAIWLEEIPGLQNTYHICARRSGVLSFLENRSRSRTVILSTKTKIPLPDPRYLKLHAAVCRIAHLSGAAEYIEDADRKHEQTGVLAYDGSSADYLRSRLSLI